MAKWIEFKEIGDTGKTKIWDVVSKDGGFRVGYVRWYGPWRKYSFFPENATIFENQCLMDIVNFIQAQMDARKV